jgi:AmmeMemoRadiSam system protein A
MCSTEVTVALDAAERAALLDVARRSIAHGLAHGHPLAVDPDAWSPALRAHQAAFVTLNRAGQLRGCIGHLEATQPLVLDVADNAFAAAFRDPRFLPLAPDELDGLEIHVSVLSPPVALEVSSEEELLRRLRPGIDGLILDDGLHRGTFLPSVWESLPKPAQFVGQLKLKAGLPIAYWSDRIRVSRYTTESFGS